MKKLFILISIITVFLMMPISHTIVILLKIIEDQSIWILSNLLLAFFGLSIIIYALKKSNLKASILGFLGAHFIFIGFFEFSFTFFARLFNIHPLLNEKTSEVLLSPALQINEATFFIFLPLFLLIYLNKQAKCPMLIWLRNKTIKSNLKDIKINKDKAYSQVSALQTVFILWAIYSLILLTLDYRILGTSHWLSNIIYTFLMIWPLVLSYKIFKYKNYDFLFRYSIAIGILYWSWIEIFLARGMKIDFYLYPLQNPLENLFLLVIFLISLIFLFKQDKEKI